MTGVQLCLWSLISGKEIWAPNITENCACCLIHDASPLNDIAPYLERVCLSLVRNQESFVRTVN